MGDRKAPTPPPVDQVRPDPPPPPPRRRGTSRLVVHQGTIRVVKTTIVKKTGTCTMFSTFDMVCPLCDLTIPGGTWHTCER